MSTCMSACQRKRVQVANFIFMSNQPTSHPKKHCKKSRINWNEKKTAHPRIRITKDLLICNRSGTSLMFDLLWRTLFCGCMGGNGGVLGSKMRPTFLTIHFLVDNTPHGPYADITHCA